MVVKRTIPNHNHDHYRWVEVNSHNQDLIKDLKVKIGTSKGTTIQNLKVKKENIQSIFNEINNLEKSHKQNEVDYLNDLIGILKNQNA